MAAYDITQIDAEEFDTTEAQEISQIYLDSTHLVVAYNDSSNDGRIKIYSIDSSYDTITYVSTLVYETSSVSFQSLVKIDDTHFALAYEQSGTNDGIIRTYSVDGSYVITEEDNIIFESGEADYISLMLLKSGYLAVAYAGASGRAFIKTYSYDVNHDLTLVDSLNYNVTNFSGHQSSICRIDDTHFAISYEIGISTFSVDSGADTITEIDSLAVSVYSNGTTTSLALVDSTHLILAYQDSSENSVIATYSFDGSYDNLTLIDSETIFSGQGGYYSLAKLDTDLFAVAYRGSLQDGYVSILTIDDSYVITEKSGTEHDTSNGEFNSLVKLDEENFALAYQGADDDGFIKTFEVDIVTDIEITPDTITTEATVNAPTIDTSLEVTPDTITSEVTVQVPAISTGGEVTPSTITIETTLYSPTVFTGIEVEASTITTKVVLYRPTQMGGLWNKRTKPTTNWKGRNE